MCLQKAYLKRMSIRSTLNRKELKKKKKGTIEPCNLKQEERIQREKIMDKYHRLSFSLEFSKLSLRVKAKIIKLSDGAANICKHLRQLYYK